MNPQTKRFLGWSALLVALLATLGWWQGARPDGSELPSEGSSSKATGVTQNTTPAQDGSPAVTLLPRKPGTEPTDAPIRYRTAAESETLRSRHRLHLEKLGIPPEARILPRDVPAKEGLETPPGKVHAITVKFVDNYLARVSQGGFLTISAEADEALAEVIREHGLRFFREQTAADDRLALLEARAMARTGKSPADLLGIVSASPREKDPAAVRAAAEDLLALQSVEFVTLTSVDAPPPPPALVDIAPPSELLIANQTYRGNGGILMDWAWTNHQTKGAGVRVTDCEYAYNANHEDLSTLVSPQPNVNSYYTGFGNDHGTAVLGILTSGENGYGMTGMVPEASHWFYPEASTVNGASQSRLAAIVAAIADSDPGDVVLLEMQTRGAQGDYGPAEYSLSVWNAVKTGTDAGILVVAAAGNGSENLDAVEYTTYRNRGDSGSIIVGAGSSARAKLDFSTYGSRIDVQGWGQGVATLAYGDLRSYAGDLNQEYTAFFSGTSSASPIVTSAVAALQSFALENFQRVLTPEEMRDVLKTTGQPQTGNLSTPIGPLPDMQAAITELIRADQSANLSDLTLFGATLAPGFDPAVVGYTADVGSTVNSIMVRPTASLPGATLQIRVNSGSYQAIASGATSSALPLVEGPNLIEVLITSPDSALLQKLYSITVTRDTASLSALSLPGATLSPVFSPSTTTYSTWVPGTTSSITVQPTAHPAGTTIKVRVNGSPYQSVGSGTPSGSLALGFGSNLIEILLTYPLRTGEKTYSVTVTRDTPNLKTLTIDGTTFDQTFNPDVSGYTTTVAGSVASAIVRPTPFVSNAQIEVRINSGGYQTLPTGSLSSSLSFNYGLNIIDVRVISPLTSLQKTYTVSLNRPGDPIVVSPTATGITTTQAVLGGNVSHAGSSAISQRGVIYRTGTGSTDFKIGDSGVTAVPVSGTTGSFTTTLTGLSPGTIYSFRAFATNLAGTTYTAAVNFTTKSDNALLSGLTFSHGSLTPGFDSSVVSYSIIASNGGDAFIVQAQRAHAGASLQLRTNGGPWETLVSGAPGKTVDLLIGPNTVDVMVTAEDGVTTTTYHLAIVRPVPPVIASPVIEGLSATGAKLGATVISDGGGIITERGIVYAPALTNPNPVIGGNSVQKVSTDGAVGSFTVPLAGLAQGVRYRFRGYCKTVTETAYSEAATFVTSTVIHLEPGAPWSLAGRNVGAAETVGFQIETATSLEAVFELSGTTGLSGLLRSADGGVIASFSASEPMMIEGILEPGVYSLEIFNAADSGKMFAFSADPLTARPDLAVGTTPTALQGAEVFPPSSGQSLLLISKGLKPVRGYFSVRNASGTASSLRVRGTKGSSNIAVQYTDFMGNQTAAVTGGYYKTGSVTSSDAGTSLTATFSPSKKLAKKKRGKLSIQKIKSTFLIDATGDPPTTQTDRVQIEVRTQ